MRPLILIVDDYPPLRELVRELLASEGYDTVTASDGREALDLIDAGLEPDLVLLDLEMPGLDGWGFLAARARSPRLRATPVIVASGSIERPGAPEGREASADFVLAKPYLPHDLLDLVAHATAGTGRASRPAAAYAA